MQALNFSMRGVLGTRNKSKSHDCERYLSPMILAAAALWELTGLILINQLKLTGLRKIVMRPPISAVHGTLTGLTVTMEINWRTIDFLTGLGLF